MHFWDSKWSTMSISSSSKCLVLDFVGRLYDILLCACLFQERNSAAKPPITTNGKLNKGPIKNGHIPSAAERELNGIKDIQRGKTFLEARSAVQKHIENMLTNNNNNNQPASSTSTSANRLPGSSSANQNTESHPPQ